MKMHLKAEAQRREVFAKDLSPLLLRSEDYFIGSLGTSKIFWIHPKLVLHFIAS